MVSRRRSFDRIGYGIALAFLGGYILLSHPFLKIPYDVWDHLLRVVALHDEGRCIVFWPDYACGRYLWHSSWATIFRWAGIDDLFVWSEIIHKAQFLFIVAVMLYATSVFLRSLLPGLNEGQKKWLALTAVLLWLIGNGTHSEEYQQSWISWYSVNYQAVAVPLFWFMAALSVRILSSPEATGKRRIVDLLLILGAALVIARVHAMELLYYLILLGVLMLFHLGKLWQIGKRHPVAILVSGMSVAAVIVFLVPDRSPVVEAFRASGWDLFRWGERILETGQWYREMRLSRFPATFSELALLSLAIGVLASGWALWDRSLRGIVNVPLFLSQVSAAFLFFLIPLTTFSAGLAGLVTSPALVYRFFWGSPWFVLLPVALYLGVRRLRPGAGLAWVGGATAAVVAILLALSPTLLTGALYANARSLADALDREAVGPQYGPEVVRQLEAILEQQTPPPDPARPDVYYIRGDLAYLVRGCLRRYVYVWRLGALPRSSFFAQGLDQRYRLVDVDVGPDFPRDAQLLRSFPFDPMP